MARNLKEVYNRLIAVGLSSKQASKLRGISLTKVLYLENAKLSRVALSKLTKASDIKPTATFLSRISGKGTNVTYRQKRQYVIKATLSELYHTGDYTWWIKNELESYLENRKSDTFIKRYILRTKVLNGEGLWRGMGNVDTARGIIFVDRENLTEYLKDVVIIY